MFDLKKQALIFYRQRLAYDQKVLFVLMLFTTLLGCVLLAINHYTTQFSGEAFYTDGFNRATAPLLILAIATIYFREIIPERVYLLVFTFCAYFLCIISGSWVTQGIQYTTFPTIDHWLLAADNALHFNQLALMKTVHQHAWLDTLLKWSYNSLLPEFILVPTIMTILGCKRAVMVFLLALMLTYPIGTMIYYFFPTTAPAQTLHSNLFLPESHATYIKFYEIRHYIKLTTTEGGLIAFPSFHVIWAILFTYMTFEKKWLFYPLIVLNCILVFSTLALGWHYLADIIASIIVTIPCISFVNYLMTRKCERPPLPSDEDGEPSGESGPLVSGGNPPSSSSLKTMPRPFS